MRSVFGTFHAVCSYSGQGNIGTPGVRPALCGGRKHP